MDCTSHGDCCLGIGLDLVYHILLGLDSILPTSLFLDNSGVCCLSPCHLHHKPPKRFHWGKTALPDAKPSALLFLQCIELDVGNQGNSMFMSSSHLLSTFNFRLRGSQGKGKPGRRHIFFLSRSSLFPRPQYSTNGVQSTR